MAQKTVVYIDEDLEDLIPDFLTNRQQDIENIDALLSKNDFDEIQKMGHCMKGFGGGYGFNEISRIGEALERAARDENNDEIERLNQRLKQYLQNVEVVYRETNF